MNKKNREPGKKGFFKELDSQPKKEPKKHEKLDWKRPQNGQPSHTPSRRGPELDRLKKHTSVRPSRHNMVTEAKEHKQEILERVRKAK